MKFGTLIDWNWLKTPQGMHYVGKLYKESSHGRFYGLLEKPVFDQNVLELRYKIYVNGKSNSGKTTLMQNLSGLLHPSCDGYYETPGVQVFTVYWAVKLLQPEKIALFRLDFWDPGDQASKKYDHIIPVCKDAVDGVMFVFSFTDKTSFQSLDKEIISNFMAGEPIVKMVVGTKFDQFPRSEITPDLLLQFERSHQVDVIRVDNTGSTFHQGRAKILNMLCESLWCREQFLATAKSS